ncbi:UNVERIFIED_CONTAM: SIR2 family protein [Kocuria sp. CPCC 205274]
MPPNVNQGDTPRLEELQATLAAHSALPYLFLGSGLSRRYLGLPDWEGLLRHFADEIGEDFDYHLASANNDLPAAATSVALKFHPHWWKDPIYASQKLAHKSGVKDEDGGLKVAIATYIAERQDLVSGRPGVDDAMLSLEVDRLRTVVVDGVITTNYDSLTDQIFPEFPAYVGQDELLLSDAQFIAETYKIHGSADQPLSLVVTEGDYERFSRRNHYLAAKLLTIFAEHPVIFVGYSLNDAYVGEILDNIATAVGPDRIDELGQRIYFVEWNSNPNFVPVIEQASLVRGGARLPITRIETNSLRWIWDALSQLERPFPAAVLRELRKHVFDLVTHPDPSQGREVVRAIPIDADGAEGVRVVFGVGSFTEKDLNDLSTISGRTLTRVDIEEDVLGIRKRPLDAENVLLYGIPMGIRPSATSFLPVHKYLSEAGRVASDGIVNYEDLPDIICSLAERKIQVNDASMTRFNRDVLGTLMTPRQIADSGLALYFKLECLTLINPDDIDLDEFAAVLRELYVLPEMRGNESPFRRALCHFDRLNSWKRRA